MPRLTKRSERHGHGTICASPDGRTFNASIYMTGGERRRARFKSKIAAQLWLDSQTAEFKPLTQAQMMDASRAFAMLPSDITLLDCAKLYLASVSRGVTKISFTDAIAKFIAAKRNSLRPVTLRGYESTLSSFASSVKDIESVADLKQSRVESELESRTPSMRNAMLRVLSAFFSWAVKSGYAEINYILNIEKSRLSRPKRSVLGVEQASAILAICEYAQPKAVPYLAVGLFAGVRPHEMRRLKPENFRNGYIYLDADIAKTSSERTVPIRANLAAWLKKYPPTVGVSPVSDIMLVKTLRALFAAVGIKDRKDILRHSYASYAYELTGDAAKVAAELGHTDTSMLFKHYRGLVPPHAGSRYFSITPDSVAQTLSKRRTQTAPKRT